MGEAKRRKIAGYVPEPKNRKINPNQVVVGHGGQEFSLLLAVLTAASQSHRFRRHGQR